ncbi:hypothetical protein [Comamonas sp. NoAH]|uniref:hypothetical protein n=1 Tax=Comamonas halotolerans TaxID=3041496 RepID=UPI0024E0910F|nr:hypothetical protein [Comamonas sp. NoAH]
MTQPLDFSSPTWKAIAAKAGEQLCVLREKNDSASMDAIRTAELRGRIAVWKELLALPEKVNPAHNVTVDPMDY